MPARPERGKFAAKRGGRPFSRRLACATARQGSRTRHIEIPLQIIGRCQAKVTACAPSRGAGGAMLGVAMSGGAIS